MTSVAAAEIKPMKAPSEQPARLFLVSYQIAADQVRLGVEKFLQDKSEAWWRYLPHTWMIVTREEPTEIISWFNFFFGGNDRMLMFEVPKDKREYFGWLPQEGWKWLREPESRAEAPKAPVPTPPKA